MKRRGAFILTALVWAIVAHAQLELCTEAQLTSSGGEHTPLWLHSNRYGLSSLDETNGYVRAGLFRSMNADSTRKWKYAFGVDIALATHFTSTIVVQQLFGEVSWKKGLLTIGAKQQPVQLKNQELSSGSQTLGINARPVPGIRLELPKYWNVPGTKGFLGLKGHLFYGWTTDDNWQKDFTDDFRKGQWLRTENTMLHTKAGYFRLGKESKPFNVELGLEMGCQFGGKTIFAPSLGMPQMDNESGLKGMWRALIPSGGELMDENYRNKEGNHVGSWLLRANYNAKTWGLSAYADHFFEDQSQMFFLDYDGYGTGENWDSWERFNWLVYDLRDIQLGLELQLKRCRWVENVVAEYIYTKYQSGAVYHDHTRIMPDHIGGKDHYYNHSIFTGWQHWGQVMGNPLYRSPLYNEDGNIEVKDNRFVAWHLGINGTPTPRTRYRIMATWQKGWGSYTQPFLEPRKNVSLMAEISYAFPTTSPLAGWNMKATVAMDRGEILGDNTGMQLTVSKRLTIKAK